MIIINERETQKRQKQINTEKNKGEKSYSEMVRAKWYYCTFKLGFFQLICKTSLIIRSKLELAFSIILKERELYKLKHVAVECRCLKLWDLSSFLICSSILVLKWQQVSPTARTTAGTSKFKIQKRT